MAIARVAGQNANNPAAYAVADSGTLVFPANVTANSLLVMAGACYDDELPGSVGVTDSRSTIYTVLSFSPTWSGDSVRVWIAYGIAPSSGACTVTVNPAGNATEAYFTFSIDEFTGVDTTTPLDVDGGNSEGASTTPSDSITTATAGALVVGVVTHNNASADAIGQGTGFTIIGEDEDNTGGNGPCHNFEFMTDLAAAAGAYSVAWTIAGTYQWAAMTAAFKPAIFGTREIDGANVAEPPFETVAY